MNSKLTLRLNKKVIEEAKKYARIHRISLSKLVEEYLVSIIGSTGDQHAITPLVNSLSGVIELENEFDYKEAYLRYLSRKHT